MFQDDVSVSTTLPDSAARNVRRDTTDTRWPALRTTVSGVRVRTTDGVWNFSTAMSPASTALTDTPVGGH